jgi:hypothetical protein
MRSFFGRFCCSMMLAISVGGFGMSLQAQETKMTHAADIPMAARPGPRGGYHAKWLPLRASRDFLFLRQGA